MHQAWKEPERLQPRYCNADAHRKPYARLVKCSFRKVAILLCALLGLGLGNGVFERPCFAQDLLLNSVVKVPQSRFQAGSVLVLRAYVENVSDKEVEGILVSTVDGVESLQSLRRVPLAPKQSTSTMLYVDVPESIAGKQLVEIKTTLYVDYGNGEVQQMTDGRPAEYRFSLGPDPTESFIGMFVGDDLPPSATWHWPRPNLANSYEMGLATRVDAGLSRLAAIFDELGLPGVVADWDVMQTAMISEPAVFDDAYFVDGLKRYVTDGGKAWILLDQVDPELVRPLLAPGQVCESVGLLELNELTVEVYGGETPIAETDRQIKSETPFNLRMVHQEGGRVALSGNGWPLAIWMPVGYGEILFTTMSPSAFLEERDGAPAADRYDSIFQTKIWANDIAQDINEPAFDKPLMEAVDYPVQLMGNPIVPKSWVAIALTGFCVVLASLGVWRIAIGELSLLGIIAPVVAVVVGIGLVVASTFVQSDQPESVGKLQVVHVSPEGTFSIIREQAAVYLKNTNDMQLTSKADGFAKVDSQVQSGIQRFVIEGFQEWSLQSDSWPAGIWRYDTKYVLPTDEYFVTGSFDSTGLQLSLPQLPSPMSDAVLNYCRNGPMLCSTNEGGLFTDGSLQADGERWIAGTLISNEQQRRLEVYQEFFRPGDRTKGLDRVVYGWTDLWEGGPKWSAEMLRKGAALVALPVRLSRPEPNAEIFIPHGLVEVRRDQGETGTTFAFNDDTGKWAEGLTMAISAQMQLVLPKEVLPFSADEIDFTLDITAPQRDVSVVVSTPEGPVEIANLSSPSIPFRQTLNDPRILSAAQSGVLTITINVSERTDIQPGASSTNVVAWQIDDLRASFRGHVSE